MDKGLKQPIRYKVLVERKGFTFFVELDYDNLPDFCTHCKMVGHYLEICKKVQFNEEEIQDREPKQRNRRTSRQEPKQAYVIVTDNKKGKGKAIEIMELEGT